MSISSLRKQKKRGRHASLKICHSLSPWQQSMTVLHSQSKSRRSLYLSVNDKFYEMPQGGLVWQVVSSWKYIATYIVAETCKWILSFNPNPAGGGGGVKSNPLDVSRDNFADFFFSSLAQLLTLFSYKSDVPFRSYATLCNRASAQNMGIFWICVQNIWKMAFWAKNPFWALKVCYLP